MKNKGIDLLTGLIHFWAITSICLLGHTLAQPVFPAVPASSSMYLGETKILTLDGNSNVINGASCLNTFNIRPSSPDNPTWATNNGLTLTFSPTLVSHVKTYTLQYLLTETGAGSGTFIPCVRELLLTVNKYAPVINYQIPDYPNLRAGLPYEVIFDDNPCTDPHNDVITYVLLNQFNGAPETFFNLNSSQNKISGTVPNSEADIYNLVLRGSDSLNQITEQSFTLTFASNQQPQQIITDISPYKFTIGEGQSSEHIIPSGIYADNDGDSIFYEYAFFNDFSSLAAWVEVVPGYEGTGKLVFNNIPQTTKTGFQIFLSDGIGSATNFFGLNFEVNLRPIASTSIIVLDIYRNLDLSVDLSLEMDAYFTDPENDPLSYSFLNVPSELIVNYESGSTYAIKGEFDISVTDMNITFKADDGISLPTAVIIQVLVQDCDLKGNRCYGPSDSECYTCTGTNVLDTTTCTDECPIGKYTNIGDNTGKECHAYGDEGDGPSNSEGSVGGDDYFRKESVCVEQGGNYYFDYSRECIRGAPFGLVCMGEMGYDCVECQTGYVMNGGNGVPLECPEGQFSEGSSCLECDVSGDGCRAGSSSDCVQCDIGFGLNGLDQGVKLCE